MDIILKIIQYLYKKIKSWKVFFPDELYISVNFKSIQKIAPYLFEWNF
jgi:hypothetical protein